MGWGLIINNVYLNRVTKDRLETVVEESEEMIKYCKEKLLAMACYTHPTVKNEEGQEENIMDYSVSEINQIFEELGSEIVKLHLASIAIENPEDVTED